MTHTAWVSSGPHSVCVSKKINVMHVQERAARVAGRYSAKPQVPGNVELFLDIFVVPYLNILYVFHLFYHCLLILRWRLKSHRRYKE